MASRFTVLLLICGLLSSASARPFTINELPSQQGRVLPFGKQEGGRYFMPQQEGWRLPTAKELEKAFQIAKEEGLYYPYANANKQGFKMYYPFSKEQRLGSEQAFAYQLSQQQGRSVPFGEEQGTQEQNWGVSYARKQDTSDEVNKLLEKVTNLFTDQKSSQQQGRSIPFGEEQSWRFRLPQEKNWQIPRVPYFLKQNTSDKINKTKLLTDEKLSQQQGRSIPFGEEQGRKIPLPQEQNWLIPFRTGVTYPFKQDTSDEAKKLLEEVTNLLTDEKLSQQQGRSIPFGEEQGRRIPLPREQNWQIPFHTGINNYALKQDTSDEVNKLSEEVTNLVTDEKLSQQQGISIPFGEEQGWRFQEQNWRIPFSKGHAKEQGPDNDLLDAVTQLYEVLTSRHTDESKSQS